MIPGRLIQNRLVLYYRDSAYLNFIQVVFDNPKWETFMSEALVSVCATLGVRCATTMPRCELHKLLLYEAGSQYVFLTSVRLFF